MMTCDYPGSEEGVIKLELDNNWIANTSNKSWIGGEILYSTSPHNAIITSIPKLYFFWSLYRGHRRLQQGYKYDIELL